MRSYFSTILDDMFTAKRTLRGALMPADLAPVCEYKTYPRMESLTLPPVRPLTMPLGEALSARRSRMSTRGHTGCSPEVLSDLLGHALRITRNMHRPYPSGGAHYPIETYAIGSVLEGAERNAYHYVPTHTLERLWKVSHEQYRSCIIDPDVPEDAFLIVFTATWERTQKKYGDFAYHLATLEGGHMAQNIALVATALGLAAQPLCGVNVERISSVLDLDYREQPFYGVLICNEPA